MVDTFCQSTVNIKFVNNEGVLYGKKISFLSPYCTKFFEKLQIKNKRGKDREF